MNRFLLLTLLLSAPLFSEAKKSSESAGTTLLEQTSQAFTGIAKKAMPATVSIKAQLKSCGMEDSLSPQDDFFRRFFDQLPFQQMPPMDAQPQLVGGSGFLVRSDGYIVTNHHVVKNASQITVVLNDGREFVATVKGSDPRTDLAVLKIEEKDLPFLQFGDSENLQVGEWVVAIGNPFGLEATLTVGVVSAQGRQDLGLTAYEDFIQTDAAINPGNSGGPLLNLQSKVIGVNTAILSRSGGYMGIGLAIPSRMAQSIIDQIIEVGTVKRAYLGVIFQPVDKELSCALNLEKQEGALVSEVMKDSPAKNGGLMEGDIVVAYNDKPVKSIAKLRNDIALMSPSTPIKLKILRKNKPMVLTISLGSQSEGEVITAEMTQKLGLDLENITPEMASRLGLGPDVEGVVISRVKAGSPAANAGLRPGYLIIGIATDWTQQKRIKNLAEFDKEMGSLGNRKHIILIVRQQNYQRYYTIRVQ
jgi:serine protease Do